MSELFSNCCWSHYYVSYGRAICFACGNVCTAIPVSEDMHKRAERWRNLAIKQGYKNGED